jgi:hypothetical protein
MMLKAKSSGKWLWIFLALACLGCAQPLALLAENICAVCGKEITGPIYLVTDEVTGEQELVCSNCFKLPRCYICGMPVKDDAVVLPDGRYLCARDAKTVVLDTNQATQICAGVKDDLDRLFSRFTFFPTNVDIAYIDRLDVQSMYGQDGYDVESPNLLGCIRPVTVDSEKRYAMRLMTGLPLVELKATCAHEYSHAWAGDNVPPARRRRLARDAEEGFCELVAYLLMDSQQEEAQKKFILRNRYTRGQVQLFIEAEQRYGFDEILDWMKYGVTARLEADHLDEVRDISQPPATPTDHRPAVISKSAGTNHPVASNLQPHQPAVSAAAPAAFRLEGILWGGLPVAIINGHTFAVNDQDKVPFGRTNVTIRCLEIQPASVRIREMDSGTEQQLRLPPN